MTESKGAASGEAAQRDVTVSGPRWLARLTLALNEQWPAMGYLAFGFYYAWIWLCYSSSLLVPPAPGSGDAIFMMYLLSTSALVVVLVLAAALERVVTPLVGRRSFVLACAAVASAATLVVRLRVGCGARDPLFLVACALTGAGTAVVALRLGCVYARASSRQAVMYAAASFALAGTLYFTAVGAPEPLGFGLMVALPLLAALLTMAAASDSDDAAPAAGRAAPNELPGGFFPRLVASVSVLSLIVGVMHGGPAFASGSLEAGDVGRYVVAGMGVVSLAVYAACASMGENFDFSRLYYPIIILLLVGVIVVPLFGSEQSLFAGAFVGVAYAGFIMMVWCLLAHVCYATGMPAVRVFGLGRGASGFGTTLGWCLAALAVRGGSTLVSMTTAAVMGLALLVVTLVVFNDRTISATLRLRRPGGQPSRATETPEAAADGAGEAGAGPEEASGDEGGAHHAGAWTRKCNAVVEEYKLSERERDVLFLLSKGRTISYIADELHISFNTAKSHIRHVYVKTGVHTRSELLDLIEGERV